MIQKSEYIPDVKIIPLEVHYDERGYLSETYRENEFIKWGMDTRSVQENLSKSRQGTLRGLHYQISFPQGKLIRVVTGKSYHVAVDLRKNSTTFGRWVGFFLSEEDHQQLWIPPGFAHGSYTLSEWAEVTYKLTNYYSPQSERTIIWNDHTLSINWNLIEGKQPILSQKDLAGKKFIEAQVFE